MGGTGTVNVVASGNWTASSDDDWIQLVSPASGSGSGNGKVEFTVSPLPNNATNINRFVRVGTLTIAGQVFTVSQHREGQVSFNAWAGQLPSNKNGSAQDAAGNGISNFVKYAFGLDPLKPMKTGLPTVSVKDGVLIYAFTKPGSLAGVRFSVRTIDQLGKSFSGNISLSKVSENNGMETWQARLPADRPAKFVNTTVVQVGLTAREVQKLLNQTLNNFTTNLTLWNIQPGLGTVMIEYGRRFAMLKKAADSNDWGMAQYQLTEATEIQEVGETTRSAKAPLLKNFEQNFLDPLAQDIQAKNAASFANHFNQAVDACNACHVATGHPYVTVQPPALSPEPFLALSATEPKAPSTSTPPAPITPAADTPLTWPEVWQQVTDGLNNVDTRLALWNVQPGLGTVMMEYGRRFALLKLAADAGDWGMAQYQLAEATEIQEVGETTRPAKAPLLKNFEQNFLDPLAHDILAKDTASFTNHFTQAVDACNACHAATGHAYVSVQPPTLSPEPFLVLSASNPSPPKTNAPPTPIQPNFPPGAPILADAQNAISNRFNALDLTLALWNIQPGLGTVMQEYGFRFALAWFAAEAGNWGMAAYQIKEATEIQEVGETTRPAKAPLLKAFEQAYLDPLNTAIAAKDKPGFENAYDSAVTGCNACHAGTGHPYVRVQRPPVTLLDYLKLGPP